MREKNVRRAAKALYESQGDDKNKLLSKRIHDPKVRERVQDQGRALVVLEKYVLPKGQDSYMQHEMEEILLRKLRKKGHRIQDDKTPDDENYAEEKRRATEARLAVVPDVLGMRLDPNKEKEEKDLGNPLVESAVEHSDHSAQSWEDIMKIREELEETYNPYPNISMKTLDLSNEDVQKEFLRHLKENGISVTKESKDDTLGWVILLGGSLVAFKVLQVLLRS